MPLVIVTFFISLLYVDIWHVLLFKW